LPFWLGSDENKPKRAKISFVQEIFLFLANVVCGIVTIFLNDQLERKEFGNKETECPQEIQELRTIEGENPTPVGGKILLVAIGHFRPTTNKIVHQCLIT
jgi:hypothetical protein